MTDMADMADAVNMTDMADAVNMADMADMAHCFSMWQAITKS